jgi:hypothetical protein
MNRKPFAMMVFLALSSLLTICCPVFAHHGSSAYSNKAVILKNATVTKFQWANPHCIVAFDVNDDKGQPVHWAGEVGSPSALGLMGWTKNAIHPGDKITVYIFQAKSGNLVGRLNKIVLADGTELKDSQLGDARGGDAGGQQPYQQ